jgi:CubicO group peptidase (beta-lactamase class C family)
VIIASACASVNKDYVNQVVGEYKLNDADKKQLIESGVSKERIKSLEKAYVLKNRQGLIIEYRDTAPLKLQPILKNPNEFFTKDTDVNIDKNPEFKVEFIFSEDNQQDKNISLRATFSGEAVKQLMINSSSAINLEYHRKELTASDDKSNEPWTRMNENNPEVDISDIKAIANSIRSGKYGDMHSILIIKNGYLILEEYFNGSNANHVHAMASATKSVTSVIIGIAVDQGLIHEDQKIVEIYKNYNIKNMSEKKREITVKNLLTMRDGLSWTQGPPWNWDWRHMIDKDDFVQFVLDKPMRHRPDSVYRYSNGASVLLGGIIGETTEYSFMEFADKFLFSPIGITSSYLALQDKKGHPGSGSLLKMTTRDMARFGLLVLNNGKWGSKQIISTSYLQRSFKAYSENLWWGMDYGYHWWLLPVTIQGRSSVAIKASGWGGQEIWILPSLNAVVVTTAWWPKRGYTELLIDLLKYKVIPALEELSFPVNKVAVSKILSDDAVSQIQFNEKEPWTGKWKVEASTQVSGIWAMKQEGKTVRSTRDSAYDFKGKVLGNRLKGKVVGAVGYYYPLELEMPSNKMSFTGTLDWDTSNTIFLKGKRIE